MMTYKVTVIVKSKIFGKRVFDKFVFFYFALSKKCNNDFNLE